MLLAKTVFWDDENIYRKLIFEGDPDDLDPESLVGTVFGHHELCFEVISDPTLGEAIEGPLVGEIVSYDPENYVFDIDHSMGRHLFGYTPEDVQRLLQVAYHDMEDPKPGLDLQQRCRAWTAYCSAQRMAEENGQHEDDQSSNGSNKDDDEEEYNSSIASFSSHQKEDMVESMESLSSTETSNKNQEVSKKKKMKQQDPSGLHGSVIGASVLGGLVELLSSYSNTSGCKEIMVSTHNR